MLQLATVFLQKAYQASGKQETQEYLGSMDKYVQDADAKKN